MLQHYESAQEGRLAFCHRVQRAGLWREVTAELDTARAELRSQGLRRAEARERAWEVVMEKYPPRKAAEADAADRSQDSGADEDDDPALAAELRELHKRHERNWEDVDLAGDVAWVYENLRSSVRPLDAPSPGAWSLLQFARQEETWFRTQLARKCLTGPDEDGSSADDASDTHQHEGREGDRRRIADLEQVLLSLVGFG